MLRVVCRFHDVEGNLTYFRSTADFVSGMVDRFDGSGQRQILFQGDHHAALDQYIAAGESFMIGDQLDRLDAHISASGYVAAGGGEE